jgi:hypothetical protein
VSKEAAVFVFAELAFCVEKLAGTALLWFVQKLTSLTCAELSLGGEDTELGVLPLDVLEK